MALLNLPESQSTVQVSIIDTTTRLRDIPSSTFFGPDLEGFERFSGVAYSFLITHTDVHIGKQTRLVFDLGPSANWSTDYAEPVVERINSWGADIQVSKHVAEILQDNGVDLESIDAVIWSHAHWDHIGHMPTFPSTVSLILGPNVKNIVYPGYKSNSASPIREGSLDGREIIELDFDTAPLKLGAFKAIDWFNDGSLYLVSAPGHSTGHINALARTTAPDSATSISTSNSSPPSSSTYIYMAADSFHHASQIRPTALLPLPSNLAAHLPSLPSTFTSNLHHLHPSLRLTSTPARISANLHAEIQTHFSSATTTPYLSIALKPDGSSIAIDRPAALATIKEIERYDADENVLVVAAHDSSLLDVLEFFPKVANEWRGKGWKQRGRWRWLNDFRGAVSLVEAERKREGGGGEEES